MFHHLPSITPLTSILSKRGWPAITLLVIISFLVSFAYASQQDWTLSGTFVGDSHAHAMFVDAQGNEQLLALGEKIQGCELIDVLRGSAKVSCGGSVHTLHLRNSVGDLILQAHHSQSIPQQQLITLSRDEVMDYVKARQRLVSEIGFLPLMEDQRVIGFTVSKIRPNTRAAALGLFNGDIIKSINGVSASKPSQFLQTVKELSSTPEVSIEVDRFGQTLAYTYILK